ncbi:SMI1/KNR4 family protein [Nocardia otitidiscaviarum]|uniref:SMI1/KNR4 family protein n=1 Tax=Nocardia otitidiscaviarum TaxID=1823 RepID=UPI001893F64F|nr:SMI1/KNR4 family protein [Nocardia otitidiscaviarum]MBF6183353.1 SMI1/KNR4 family protein [Nocardia otitidiscaviarum]
MIEDLTVEHQRQYERYLTDGATPDTIEWIRTPPNPPATAEAIHAAEQRIGKRLDRQLRQWPEHADGWEFVWGTTGLYSTAQLTTDSPARETLIGLMDEFDVTADEIGVRSLDDLIVIGTDDSEQLFIVTTGCDDQCDSAPVWEIEGSYEKYPNLRTYLTTVARRLEEVD